jgi:hypothetical protein
MLRPQSKVYLPAEQFLAWHGKEVFKQPGRHLADTPYET